MLSNFQHLCTTHAYFTKGGHDRRRGNGFNKPFVNQIVNKRVFERRQSEFSKCGAYSIHGNDFVGSLRDAGKIEAGKAIAWETNTLAR